MDEAKPVKWSENAITALLEVMSYYREMHDPILIDHIFDQRDNPDKVPSNR